MKKEIKAKNVVTQETKFFKCARDLKNFFNVPDGINIALYAANRYKINEVWRLSYTGQCYFQNDKHKAPIEVYGCVTAIRKYAGYTLNQYLALDKEEQAIVEDKVIERSERVTLCDMQMFYKVFGIDHLLLDFEYIDKLGCVNK